MRRPRRNEVVIGALIGAVAVVLAAVLPIILTHNGPPPPPACVLPGGLGPRACIESPRAGYSVGKDFTVTGKLADIPVNSHIWVATQVVNLVWPKQPEVTIGPAFNLTVQEGGNPPGGKFSVVVLLVNDQGQKAINDWLSSKTGAGLTLSDYSGSISVLATVADLHL